MDVAFFDASVLFKAAVTRFLLGAERVGEFRVAWSDEVIEEARRNLIEAGRPRALLALEENLAWPREPMVTGPDSNVQSSLTVTDEKDRHVLAAAAAAHATVLVTANVKDFDVPEASALGIRIVTPDEFAVEIAQRNVDALVRHVERVPAERLERYLQILELELPLAVALIEPLLRD